MTGSTFGAYHEVSVLILAEHLRERALARTIHRLSRHVVGTTIHRGAMLSLSSGGVIPVLCAARPNPISDTLIG